MGLCIIENLNEIRLLPLRRIKVILTEACINLSNDALSELEWWIENIEHSFSSLIQSKPNIIIQSDASGMGWGATNLTDSCGGKWNESEKDQGSKFGINYLEMLAALYALQSLCKWERYPFANGQYNHCGIWKVQNPYHPMI